jgi:hypothetical protein
VIDVNDWPSFAVVRDLAGEKIARARQAGTDACRRLGFEIVFLNVLLVWVSSVQNRNDERRLAEVRGAGPSERRS